ncbi:hypothetical protein CLOM_g1875 [Closterium sp. NIES-68]|nr:hypothetical protein CLOM_g1875 [Closterium sp. NIES-68]
MASDSSVDLTSVDALELLPDNTAVNWHTYAQTVTVLLSSVTVNDYNLKAIVHLEERGLQPSQPDAPAGPAPPPPGDPPVSPGDPPTFAPDVNDPQSSETAIRTYRAGLTDHVRQQLLFEASRAEHDAATAAYNTYEAALAEYVRRERAYITDLAAWRVADRRALTILLATIPPTLKRELAPTSSSHLWRLLTDLYDRQDIATLYSLIKEFQSLTMDSTTGAAAFTRRVLDLARRLAALGVPYPDPRCGQTTHATDSCFKALSDEWFARGNTGTPPRWSSLSPRPTPQEVRTSPLFQPVSSPLAHQAVASYCELHGIRQTHTLPHSPQQNGVAESRVREITKIARCLLVHASYPPSLWGYALLHATLLTNLYPHPILPSTTPTELWTSAKPNVSSLRVWGSRASFPSQSGCSL